MVAASPPSAIALASPLFRVASAAACGEWGSTCTPTALLPERTLVDVDDAKLRPLADLRADDLDAQAARAFTFTTTRRKSKREEVARTHDCITSSMMMSLDEGSLG